MFKQLRVKQLCFYSNRASVQSKFTTIGQVKKYLEQPSWSLKESFNKIESVEEVSQKEFDKLMKLSGFSQDTKGFKKALNKQIAFINQLDSVPLTGTSVNERYARLLPRKTKSLTYTDLLTKIKEQKSAKYPDETTGYWDPTSAATASRNKFFVVAKNQFSK
ncbi:hypothetical protein KAFR_0K01650 [Kazachstania africana CBS 2517]|uniref:Glutamyl-tRNA(Gln) amidotransferase subunit F, mitochondrial n=1 Tax=Kazachstania africana (strain ATCC 22294 / BCRC 22015 / CBS 2517 / CECT 1963 / NBRC 1671 / NRRL Y-8276) TaxID=1071382 RepID=H2B1L9_KAZAF|nr:hypothetical protein KAFR_0K01650 [Kazachstania africana CBS 2517]CCF60519.1 hypothetical protein KAFR_0K01650 [Kazachstania africana CBS 2517]